MATPVKKEKKEKKPATKKAKTPAKAAKDKATKAAAAAATPPTKDEAPPPDAPPTTTPAPGGGPAASASAPPSAGGANTPAPAPATEPTPEDLTEQEQALLKVYKLLKEQQMALEPRPATPSTSTTTTKAPSIRKDGPSFRREGGSGGVKRPTSAFPRLPSAAAGGMRGPQRPGGKGMGRETPPTLPGYVSPPLLGPATGSNTTNPVLSEFKSAGAVPLTDTVASPAVRRERPYDPSRSLDRNRFASDHVIRGYDEDWDAKDANEPLILPLPNFSYSGKQTVAISATIPFESRQFSFYICPPCPPDSLPPELIVIKVDPRKIYKGGVMLVNHRKGVPMNPKEASSSVIKLADIATQLFGNTITIQVTLSKESVLVLIDDNVCGPNYDNPLNKEATLPESLSLVLPNMDDDLTFPNNWLVHEVWWGPADPSIRHLKPLRPRPSVGAAPNPMAGQPPSLRGPPLPTSAPNPYMQPGPPTGMPAVGPPGGSFTSMLGLLGSGLKAAGSGGPVVLQIANLPEVFGPEVGRVKDDLSRMLSDVNAEPREIRFNEGQTVALALMANTTNLGEVIQALDWADYRGKKIRVSRSNKWKG